MRILTIITLLSLVWPAYAEPVVEPVADSAHEQEIHTKIGTLTVVPNEKHTSNTLKLNGKPIFDYQGYELSLSKPINVNGEELVLIYENADDIACPGHYLIFEAHARYQFSKEFGNCSPAFQAFVKGDTLEIVMPRYIAHPDKLNKWEIRTLKKTNDVFIWKDGNLYKRKTRK